MPTIPENSTGWLTITFKDRDGKTESPNSFRYRIDTYRNAEVKDWETITGPSGSHEIKLTPSQNRIIDEGNSGVQKNIVTIHAMFGLDDERYDTYSYLIEDFKNVN